MAKSSKKPGLWLMALASLLVLSASQAATHGHGKRNGGSLLPECQGTAALPSPHCGQTPTPAFDKQGRLWLAFAQHGHVYLTHSDDLGASFSPPLAVNRTPEPISSDGENQPQRHPEQKIPGNMVKGSTCRCQTVIIPNSQSILM
ncbi:MAG: hypothetical protein ABFS39_15570 [Pseudomonadota bacterium]